MWKDHGNGDKAGGAWMGGAGGAGLEHLEAQRAELLLSLNELDAKRTTIRSEISVLDAERRKLLEMQRDEIALDGMISRVPNDEPDGLILKRSIYDDEVIKLQANARDLLFLARQRVFEGFNYIKLFSILVFFLVYCSALMTHQSLEYNVQSSVILSGIMGSLPVKQPSSFFNGGGPGSNGQLTRNDDFYAWLNDSVLNIIFQDAVCGDGICQFPQEYEAVGRFGCVQDCGLAPFESTMTVDVDLRTIMLERYGNKPVLGSLDPGFRYNIMSNMFNDYVFPDALDPSSDDSVQFTAFREDVLELHLFQTNSLLGAIDVEAIERSMNILPSSLPLSNATFPWKYGDAREMIFVTHALLTKLEEYCFNRVGGNSYNARVNDSACSDVSATNAQGYPNYFTNFDVALQLMGSYGIAGDITIPVTTGLGIKLPMSLISGLQADPAQPDPVLHCSPTPSIDPLSPDVGSLVTKQINNMHASCSSGSSSSAQLDDTVTSPSTALPANLGASVLIGPNGNPLNLAIKDLGKDDGGYWRCYTGKNDVTQNKQCWSTNAQWQYDSFNSSNKYSYEGAVYVGVDASYWYVDAFHTDPLLVSKKTLWLNGTGAAPTLADAGLRLMYSVETAEMEPGSLPNASCDDGGFTPLSFVKQLEYSFKTRLVVLNSTGRMIRAWLCKSSGGPPMNVSVLNITDGLRLQGVKPLEPGPLLSFYIPLLYSLDDSVMAAMLRRFCEVVYTAYDERCTARVFSVKSSSFLNITWLGMSNSRLTRASYLLSQLVVSQKFKAQFPVVDQDMQIVYGHIYAPRPRKKLGRSSVYGCVTHYDCEDGLFCSTRSLNSYSKGFQGGGGPGPYGFSCDLCKYCMNDFRDPIDVYCPRDKCGLQSGQFPECVNGTMLYSNAKCTDKYKLNLSGVPKATQSASVSAQGYPQALASKVKKTRFLTPYNRLIGAVTISQKRLKGTCTFKNDSLGDYMRTADQGLSPTCKGSDVSADPFGVDPVFSSTSSLFKGDVAVSSYYSPSELADADQMIPFGFFPHQYDGSTRSVKRPQLVVPREENTFKLFFPEGLTAVQAKQMLQYMVDGDFLDSGTQEVTVEMTTYNANLNLFATFDFTFVWEEGGKISWDYDIKSLPAYLYPENSKLLIGMDILCVIFLCFDGLAELRDLLSLVNEMSITHYIFDFWNVLEILHFFLMWTGWSIWLYQLYLSTKINIPENLELLKYEKVQMASRFFETDSNVEFDFLTFTTMLRSTSDNFAYYRVITSICVVFFVFRLLKSMDFQPRIALVTQTIFKSADDLAHFLLLFLIITIGYAVSGFILFGHQYEGFSTLLNSVIYLIITLIAFNPDEGWVQMSHAGPDWAFLVFLCTWLLIGFFVLLNIFLAILINGYEMVRGVSETDSSTVFEEIFRALKHEVLRVFFMIFGKQLGIRFLSNHDLISRIKENVPDCGMEDIIEEHEKIDLAGKLEIPLESQTGRSMKANDVKNILHTYFSDDRTSNCGSNEGNDNLKLLSIMRRHGRNIAPVQTHEAWSRQEETFFRRLKIQSMQRLLQSELSGKLTSELTSLYFDRFSKGSFFMSHINAPCFRLTIAIRQMRSLPRMDVFRGADPYCEMFLEGTLKHFRTEVRRGVSEQDWVWDPSLFVGMEWRLANDPESMRVDRQLVIMIYDKDQITSDDLIGCTTVGLDELLGTGVVDGWRTIKRPPRSIRYEFRINRSKPEINLRAELHPVYPTQDQGPKPADTARTDECPVDDCQVEMGSVAPCNSSSTSPRASFDFSAHGFPLSDAPSSSRSGCESFPPAEAGRQAMPAIGHAAARQRGMYQEAAPGAGGPAPGEARGAGAPTVSETAFMEHITFLRPDPTLRVHAPVGLPWGQPPPPAARPPPPLLPQAPPLPVSRGATLEAEPRPGSSDSAGKIYMF